MTEPILKEAQKLVHAEIQRLIEVHYPKRPKKRSDESFNRKMRQGANLMLGILSSEQAQQCKNQVKLAIGYFKEAEQDKPEAWAATNALAKCYYLIGYLDNAEKKNLIAKEKANIIHNTRKKKKSVVEARLCSHYFLQSQIYLDRSKLEMAEENILHALSLSPQNYHARKGHLRILSKKKTRDFLGQIPIFEKLESFPNWVPDLIFKIDAEEDFAYIREQPEWRKIRQRWLSIVEVQIKKAQDESESVETPKHTRLKAFVRTACFVGLGLALRFLLSEVSDFLNLDELFSQESIFGLDTLFEGDVEPFSLDGTMIAGDVEPFLVSIGDANHWIHDLICC